MQQKMFAPFTGSVCCICNVLLKAVEVHRWKLRGVKMLRAAAGQLHQISFFHKEMAAHTF